jgi:hypothetical protein
MAVKLYMALWHESERFCSREVTRTVAQLQDLVGGSPNSHAKARVELVEAGLVLAEPFGREGFVFHLCDPATGVPWPKDPREKVHYERTRESIREGDSSEPATFRKRKRPKGDIAGISFPFGANNPNSSSNPNEVMCQVDGGKPEPPTWDEIERYAQIKN